MLHEASTLLNGVALLKRMRRTNAREPEPETG
jgi:hypothetical protein